MPHHLQSSRRQRSHLPPPGPRASALAGSHQRQQLRVIARQVMDDPLLKRQLVERVLDLMHEDLQHQHQRTHRYGGKF